jgi:hypothetical protein
MKNSDTEHWIDICSDMMQLIGVLIGVTILFIPMIVTLMLVGSFFTFAASKAANSRVVDLLDDPEVVKPSAIKRPLVFATTSYGVAFTLLTVSFSLTAYYFLGVIAGSMVLIIAWVVMEVYSFAVYRSHFISDKKTLTWFILEAIVLILLVIDWLEIINWI